MGLARGQINKNIKKPYMFLNLVEDTDTIQFVPVCDTEALSYKRRDEKITLKRGDYVSYMVKDTKKKDENKRIKIRPRSGNDAEDAIYIQYNEEAEKLMQHLALFLDIEKIQTSAMDRLWKNMKNL